MKNGGRWISGACVGAAALGLCGCELAIPDVTHKGPNKELVVRDGRLRALDPAPASAGSLRVVGAALDIGAPACEGDGNRRTCVRGGMTAQGSIGK